jgi:hypothetical protein
MNGIEIVGYAALYILGFIIAGYGLIGIIAFFNRKGGLETIPIIIGPSIIMWIFGAIVGLVLLGQAIG